MSEKLSKNTFQDLVHYMGIFSGYAKISLHPEDKTKRNFRPVFITDLFYNQKMFCASDGYNQKNYI